LFYYLEDHATGAVLFIHREAYIVSNLKSGILDCYLNTFLDNSQTVNELQNHNEITTILKIGASGTIEIPVTDALRRKRDLIKLRAPAFELLLKSAEKYRNKNLYGFHPTDTVVIEQALSNQNKIGEYAQVMGISAEFAKSELNMIIDSVHTDRFKVFTVCNLWKHRINSCESTDTMQQYMTLIAQSFSLAPDIPNV
jgi:hypothetical protein